MEHDYWQVLNLYDRLERYTGYLDAAGLKERNEVQGAYNSARNKLVYELMIDCPDAETVIEKVNTDFGRLVQSNPGWDTAVENVREQIIERIRQESRKSLFSRRSRYYAVPIFACLTITAYFGVWLYNDLDVDKPFETKEGLLQRAKAFDKMRNFDEWNSSHVQRGAFLKPILLAPIEPDEAELRAAGEFAGATLEGYAVLEREGYACGLRHGGEGSSLSDSEMSLIDKVSTFVQASAVKWQDPAVITLLAPIANAYPCANAPIVVGSASSVTR